MQTPTRALSVRQPWAELILRGLKTAEYRTRATRVIGEPFYLYAAKSPGPAEAFARFGCDADGLPTGLLVGTAVLVGCRRVGRDPGPEAAFGATAGCWAWDLADVRPLAVPVAPRRHPQPTWFRPFDAQQLPRRAA